MLRRAVLLILALAGAAAAEDGPAQFRTGDDARGWEAVGRLSMGGRSLCTGALIEEDLVLTAAHCLFDPETGAAFAPDDITFEAGFRNGRALAYRGARQAVHHPDYVFTGQSEAGNTPYDLALVRLTRPVRTGQIEPFPTLPTIFSGMEVGLVSYAHDRAEAPALQEVCRVLGRSDGMLVSDCAVDFGSSGAPIFRIRDGRAQIVSVVSSKAVLGDRNVAIGVDLTFALAAVRAELDERNQGFGGISPGQARIVSPGERSTEGGAKFIRPGGS